MRKFWTDKLDNLLRRHYPKGDIDALAAKIGVTKTALKARASVIGLHRKVNMHHPWTEKHDAFLRKHYATMTAADIARKTKHSEKAVYMRARLLGLAKDPEFIRECGRKNTQHPNAVAHRFRKGQEPPNKGKRIHEFMTKEGIEASSRTRFRKGHLPANTKPIGYERINQKDGYVYVKVSMDEKMVLKHRWVWEQANGPIPEGHNVMFRDGDRMNCNLENLELVSREEAARRQVGLETPEARKKRIRKCVETRNKTIRLDKARIHFGLEPHTKLVKRW